MQSTTNEQGGIFKTLIKITTISKLERVYSYPLVDGFIFIKWVSEE